MVWGGGASFAPSTQTGGPKSPPRIELKLDLSQR